MKLKALLASIVMVLLTSCGEMKLVLKNTSNEISGQVVPMVGLVANNSKSLFTSFYAYAAGCSAEVSLYKISLSGELEQPAIATTQADSSAKFKLDVQDLLLNANYVDYIIEVVGSGGGGCDVVYQRPLMGDLAKQDVDYATTLISQTLNSDLPKKLTQIKGSELTSLMNSMTAASLNDTYDLLVNDNSIRNRFMTLFDDAPERLLYASPTVISETAPSVLSEEATHQFSLSTSHWNTSYSGVIKWKLDGVVIQVTPTTTPFFYTPGRNESGAHVLEATIGRDDGAGDLDLTAPTLVKTYNLLVNNNYLPVLPSFSIPAIVTTSSSVVATVDTGASLENCDSFSAFAFTVNNATAPAASSITETCTSASQQVTLNLSNGANALRIWVKDSSGLVVCSTPTSIFKDVVNPSVSLSSTASLFTSGATMSLTYSATDNHILSVIELFSSEDNGVSYTKVTDLSASNTTYSMSAPVTNVSSGKLKIKATDSAGLFTESVINFSVDASAPSAPSMSLASASITNQLQVLLTNSNCTDTVQVIVTGSATTPSVSDANWQSCNTTASGITYTLSSGDGAKALYTFAKDLAGNISAASSVINLTLDQTAPTAPNLAAHPFTAFNSTSLTFTASACSGISHLLISGSSTTPALGSPSWQACSTTAGATTHTNSSSAEGSHAIYLWAKDTAGNISTSRTVNAIIDSQTPVISSFSINDGDTYTGTSFVSLGVNVADNMSSMQVHFVEANATTGDCTSEYNANTDWFDWTSSSQRFSFALSNSDSVKKVCVWARDTAGNITVQTPSSGADGVTSDTIQFFVASPPRILSLNVFNTANSTKTYTVGNNAMTINWSVSSTLAMPNNPISISYSTNGSTYKDVVTDGDISNSANITWVGGIGTGLTSSSGNYTSFAAPTSFFRIKIVVKDISGNIGIPVISDLQNGGSWSVYAGTTDRGDGGSGKSALLRGQTGQTPLIAIHPTLNDIYAFDADLGIRKLDAKTGIVSTFIYNSSTNNLLSNGGILPATPLIQLSSPIIYFDKNGLLYLSQYSGSDTTTISIYQINPVTRAVSMYILGGTNIGSGATPPASPASINIARFLGIDDENSIYLMQNCIPGSAVDLTYAGHGRVKIIKVTQNPTTKAAQDVLAVAGNCAAYATPANGSDAINSPLPRNSFAALSNVVAWEGGKYVYFFGIYASDRYKIIDGIYYSTTTLTDVISGIYQTSGKIIASRGASGIAEITPNINGANGDVLTSLTGSAAAGCSEDDINASSSCPTSNTPPVQNAQEKVFFTDGNPNNGNSPYRVRYISTDNKIKTIFGTKPFYGEGLTADLARGKFAGIYYKKGTEANLAAFPEGLYFAEASGPAFGYINPANKIISTIWGDQSLTAIPSIGTTASNQISMASPYSYINGQLLTFDPNGLPWIGAYRRVYALDSNKIISAKMADTFSGTGRYESRANDATVSSTICYVDGFQNNLQVASNGLSFMLGAFDQPSTAMKPVLKALNFGTSDVGEILAGKLKHVMGQTTTAAFSSDSSTDPTATTSKTFSSTCLYGGCKTFYDESANRLYFSEGNRLRYVTSANSPSTSTLVTLVDVGRAISNFTFSSDMATLYYISSGLLYCRNITSTRAECDAADPQVGPPTGTPTLSISPNQFAWKDSSTLFISNYGGLIYQYTVP